MNNRLYTIILLYIFTILFLNINITGAKTYYKWTDKAGKIHISDHEPSPKEAVSVVEVAAKEQVVEKPPVQIESQGADVGVVSIPFRLDRLKEMIPNKLTVKDANSLTLFAQFVFMFLFINLCLYLITRRTQVSYAWLSWIPLINLFPLVGAAGYSWYVALYFIIIPVVSVALAFHFQTLQFVLINFAVTGVVLIILSVICWMRVCVNLQSSRWLGLLVMAPYVNLIVLCYLAFKEQPVMRGFYRMRPTVVTLMVWAGCVAAYAMMAPHFTNSQWFETPKVTDSFRFDVSEDSVRVNGR